MSTGDPVSNPAGLVARVKAILTTPKTEWPIIDAEPATVGGLFTNYIIWLAAIGPICTIIGQLLFPIRILGVVIARSPTIIVGTALLGYVFGLLGVWVVSLIVNALAPSFDGVKNPVAALKVVAYSYTATWVAGVFNIIPMLGVLALLAMIYGFYIMYLGLPVLMKSPADKSAVYVIVTIVVAVIVYFVFAAISAAIATAVLVSTAATLTI